MFYPPVPPANTFNFYLAGMPSAGMQPPIPQPYGYPGMPPLMPPIPPAFSPYGMAASSMMMAPPTMDSFQGASPQTPFQSASPLFLPSMNPWGNPFAVAVQQLQFTFAQTLRNWQRAEDARIKAEESRLMAEHERQALEMQKQEYIALGTQLENQAKLALEQQKQPTAPPQPVITAPLNQSINTVPPASMGMPPQQPNVQTQPFPNPQAAEQGQPSFNRPSPPEPQANQPQPENPNNPFQLNPQSPLPPEAPVAPPEVLSQILNQPITPDNFTQKQKALQQIARQGAAQASPELLEAVKTLARTPLSEQAANALGIAKPQAEELRQDALWTLGLIGSEYPKEFNTQGLPGLGVLEQVLSNPKESPSVRAASIQALRALNRPGDPRIQADIAKAEEVAQHDANREVQDQVLKAKQGEPIATPEPMESQPAPISEPSAPGGATSQPPAANPSADAGMPQLTPEMLAQLMNLQQGAMPQRAKP